MTKIAIWCKGVDEKRGDRQSAIALCDRVKEFKNVLDGEIE
ncbi:MULTISPECIES: hypothetical protein [Nostoc]|nr:MULTISPECIES: hypothetical protein [Nostoc]